MIVDAQLEAAIRELLAARAESATICPSEAARAVAGDEDADWRALMPAARQAAAGLVEAGEVEIVQGGSVVDLGTARGPIRIRRRISGAE